MLIFSGQNFCSTQYFYFALNNVPTKKGFDRDEFPMAVCAEGGTGADIKYITPSDNRGAGSFVGNKLDKLSDGTKVKIVVK